MKKFTYLVISCLVFLSFTASIVQADTYVNGYYRSNGTYVNGHYRSSPDGNPYNNYSFPGNTNPYTGKTAPGNADTYLNNYYGGSSYSLPSYSYTSSYTPTYTTPTYTSSYKTATNGYYIGDMLFCNYNFYNSSGACVAAPSNGYAYGGTSFYCDYGYQKTGSSCKKIESSYSYSSYSSPTYTSTQTSKTNNIDERCRPGYSKYDGKCIAKIENAQYNGSSYTCNNDFYVDSSGSKCVGIDTYCKEKLGIGSYGIKDQCYCNYGAVLDSVTNKCIF